MTPEGRTKARVKKLLAGYPGLYQHWPVLNGMGAPEVDCNVAYEGRAVAIECKRPSGGKLTPRQVDTMTRKWGAGVVCLVVYAEEHFHHLSRVLDALRVGEYHLARQIAHYNLRTEGVIHGRLD